MLCILFIGPAFAFALVRVFLPLFRACRFRDLGGGGVLGVLRESNVNSWEKSNCEANVWSEAPCRGVREEDVASERAR